MFAPDYLPASVPRPFVPSTIRVPAAVSALWATAAALWPVLRVQRHLLLHVPPLGAALLRSGWRMTRHPQRGPARVPPYTFVNVFCFRHLHFVFTRVNTGRLRILAMSCCGVNTFSSSQLLCRHPWRFDKKKLSA